VIMTLKIQTREKTLMPAINKKATISEWWLFYYSQ